jgi:thymidylate kinase
MVQGIFLMVDGPDGAGKGVVIDSLKEHLTLEGKRIFDLREYWKEHNDIPEATEVAEYDVICSCEPTCSMVGKVIREEIVMDNGRRYSALTTAHAFSLDREILYRKLLIPARQAGKVILQERGVTTSLVYQPIQQEQMNLQDIMNLPGNRLALKNAPDMLMIIRIDATEAVRRLEERHKKRDNAIFENVLFQRKVEERYESEWLRKLFENFKAKVVYLDTNSPLSEEDTKANAVKIWKDLIATIGKA